MKKYWILSIFLFTLFNNIQAQVFEKWLNEKQAFRKDTLFTIQSDSLNMPIPVVILHGDKPGPTLAIIAGIHGYEYVPIMAAQKFLKDIDIKHLYGTVILLPMATSPSFYHRHLHGNPLDDKNPNREFPGKATGSITEIQAAWITNNIIKHADIFLDMHGGDGNEDLAAFACYYDRKDKPQQTTQAKELCEASGLQRIVSYPYTLKDSERSQYAFKEVVQQGKVGFSLEIGGLGSHKTDEIELNTQAIFNTLAQLKMYKKAFSKPKNLIYYQNQVYISAPASGIFYSSYKSGEEIQKGQLIGKIEDEFGNLKAEVHSPVTGTILYKIGTPPINKGESAFCIGLK